MAPTPEPEGDLEALLAYVHERRHFDFRGYKRASLSRRILKRMQDLGIDDYQRYMDVLEANPDEFSDLFNTILINVTSFLRDREAWDILAESVLPAIVRAKGLTDPIRVWSAGCASGEEPYSLAVLLAEALGEDRFRSQVKIYATDADSEALVQARHGGYPVKDLEEAFGESRTTRFFDIDQDRGVFRTDLRRALIFGRHDLVLDPPISKIDLLSCRNTLMYFTSDVQQQVLTNFHFALTMGGYLFLGKSEALVARRNLFEPVDPRRHIFIKDGDRPNPSLAVSSLRSQPSPAANELLAESLLEQSQIPQLVVDAQTNVLLANLPARRLLSIGLTELGNPVKEDLLVFPESDLTSIVDQVMRHRRAHTAGDVTMIARSGEVVTFDAVVAPIEHFAGVSVALIDVSRYQVLREELERSQRELESAYEELQSAVEELETTNEELQSTNEELETTNEELHSTNEELETMNEELQSTNEELETINTELRTRTIEVDELNTFLQSILASLKSVVIVLGPEMEVRAWNHQAEELWGLRSDEVQGQHFLNLDIGFPVEKLSHLIRAVLSGRADGHEMTQAAVNRRGRTIDCAVTVGSLMADGEVRGAIVLMDVEASADSVGAPGG